MIVRVFRNEAGVVIQGGESRWLLDDFPAVRPDDWRLFRQPAFLLGSERLSLALQTLQREHPFAALIVPMGLGFRSLQAKRAGLAFGGVTVGVLLDEPLLSRLFREGRWPTDLDDLLGDYCERKAWEWADVQLFQEEAHLAWVREMGWQVGDARPAQQWQGERMVSPLPDRTCPLVTVGVTHYNLGEFLPETLAAIAGQTYRRLEVIVLDDGSTDPASRRIWESQKAQYRQFRFVEQVNLGPGAARNRIVQEAQGEFVVLADADNLLSPFLVERLVQGLQRHPGAAAMTCYFAAFERSPDVDAGRFLYTFRPTGGPHVLASVENVYGDTTALYRTAALREIPIDTGDPGVGNQDWETFVRLVQGGYTIEVLPEVLVYYRHREASLTRSSSRFLKQRRVLRQFFRGPVLPLAEQAALWTLFAGWKEQDERVRRNPLWPFCDGLFQWAKGVAARFPRLYRKLRQWR